MHFDPAEHGNSERLSENDLVDLVFGILFLDYEEMWWAAEEIVQLQGHSWELTKQAWHWELPLEK